MKINKYINQTQNTEIINWISHNLKNYLEKNPENVGEIEHIIDCFNYKASKGKKLKLKKMSYEEAKALSEKWVKTMIKKAGNIVETEDDVTLFHDFKDGMRLVQLVGENAFKREGKLMSHCVSSYYGKEDIKIYSLRDSKNNPHCTLEVTGSEEINQIKGKGNGSIHPKYIKYILKSLKKLGKDVRSSELTYLGYDEISKNLFAFILQNFPNTKYLTFKGKNFIYRHQEIK